MPILTPSSMQIGRTGSTPGNGQSGFSMLEMVVAMLILSGGLLALAAAFSYAMTASSMARNVTDAKTIIGSTLENIENLRNNQQLTFGQISNTGAGLDQTGGSFFFPGFPDDFRPVTDDPGPDGIFGTTDDLKSPGPNETYGDGDDRIDNKRARTGFSRQILITSLTPYLKKIQVTVHYPGHGKLQTLEGTMYLNNDARGTFRR